MNDNLLEIKKLFVEYTVDEEVVKAVSDLSLNIKKGESLGLVGETGAGKTTTALSIIGLVPDPPGKIVEGEILYKNEDLRKYSEKQMRRVRGSEISMIFQDPMTSLNPVISVGDQIQEVILLHKKISRADATIEAIKTLELVGIPGSRYDEYPHQFSGGMKQRIVIACALACNPNLLIADEPTTALDVTIQAQVLVLIEKLKKEFNTSLLMITHDLGVVAEICDRVGVMYAGSIVEMGAIRDVYENPLHPYTKGLFNSLPRLNDLRKRLEPIPGAMPNPTDLSAGCSFAPRCKFKSKECDCSKPQLLEITSGHLVSCFKVSSIGCDKVE
ncbi:MAG: ABC transporter ATP-binding protein [Tissierellia bacterium]|jgi:peptide/nickel transport system ATP-binding protein|nr:ABC transporter ATP-binding protein [Tissierellia bacterium]